MLLSWNLQPHFFQSIDNITLGGVILMIYMHVL